MDRVIALFSPDITRLPTAYFGSESLLILAEGLREQELRFFTVRGWMKARCR